VTPEEPDQEGGEAGAERQPTLSAEFTFVARDPVTHKSAAVPPLAPQTDGERRAFDAVAVRVAARRAAEAAAGATGFVASSPGAAAAASAAAAARFERESWIAARLAEATAVQDMPALAGGSAVLARDTALQHVFVCQPQQVGQRVA